MGRTIKSWFERFAASDGDFDAKAGNTVGKVLLVPMGRVPVIFMLAAAPVAHDGSPDGGET